LTGESTEGANVTDVTAAEPGPPTAPDGASGSSGKMQSHYLMTKKSYLHPMKTYVWITMLLIGLMSVLYFVLGLGPNAQGSIPPAFGFGASDLYFHSIAIGMAALAVYFVVIAFDLEKHEPKIDFPLSYRALVATILGSIGAFFYLRPVFNAELAPIPLGFILLGLILLADVGGALLVQLYLLPGKLSGTYDASQNRLGMIPRWRYLPSWKDFRKMDSTYWLTFVTVIGAFIAGITGFVVFWLNYMVIDIGVSPGLFGGYIAWLGGAPQFLGVAMGSHSHAIVMALILGVVAVVAKRFNVLSLTGWKRTVAKVGLWVGATGIGAVTVVFFLEAYTTVFPGGNPGLFFASNPGPFSLYAWGATDVNGMAADDTMMLWASLGAMILLVPLLFTEVRGRPAWKDPIRASILGTWILAYIATPIEGFYIEFHEATLSGAPPDVVFGNLQYFALIGITLVCMSLLAIDLYQESRAARSTIAVFAYFSTLVAVAGGYFYVYANASTGSPGYWVVSIALALMDLALIGAMVAVYLGRSEPIPALSIQPELGPSPAPRARPTTSVSHSDLGASGWHRRRD